MRSYRKCARKCYAFSKYCRLLASGDMLQSVAFSYNIGKTTASKIFRETCNALWMVLKDEFVRAPTKERWREIAKDFWEIWNFPLCLGAIDGKHVMIRAPDNSGTMFYNHKHFFSIVLLAVIDANYCFSTVSIGSFGKENDAGIFGSCEFGRRLKANRLDIPEDTKLPGTEQVCPHVFVGDDAFPLSRNLMKPYPGKFLDPSKDIFNYRLSRARRISENAFGILQSRWRCLSRKMEFSPDTADSAIKACVALHNYLKKTDFTQTAEQRYVPPHFIDYQSEDGEVQSGKWRDEISKSAASFQAIQNVNSNNYTQEAAKIRDKLKDYFVTFSGRVPWQDKVIQKGRNVLCPLFQNNTS